MMYTQGVAHVLLFGLLFLLLGTTAEAQLAPDGTFGGTFGWYATNDGVDAETGSIPLVEKFGGAFFHDKEQGFLHHAGIICQGVRHTTEEALKTYGDCVVTDRDGHTARLLWQCEGKEVCEGQGHWTQGDGKYTGITGNVVFSRFALKPTAAGYSLWRGSWQLPASSSDQTSQTENARTASTPVARRMP
jgi:hypothetical protein